MRNLNIMPEATFTATEWSKLRLGLDKDASPKSTMSTLVFATIVVGVLVAGALVGVLLAL